MNAEMIAQLAQQLGAAQGGSGGEPSRNAQMSTSKGVMGGLQPYDDQLDEALFRPEPCGQTLTPDGGTIEVFRKIVDGQRMTFYGINGFVVDRRGAYVVDNVSGYRVRVAKMFAGLWHHHDYARDRGWYAGAEFEEL